MKKPILSVSMIVKNEEVMIGKILEDCSHFADEIVVCDTGSNDDTVKIAESFGAKMVYYEWSNDFSAARNVSHNACSGQYVLWVDADDRIVKSQQARLRKFKKDFLTNDMSVAYLMKLITDDGGDAHYLDQLRIYPNLKKDMWSGKIHESTIATVRKLGLEIRITDTWVYHEGYTNPAMLTAKIKRNVEYLEEEVRESDNPIKVSYLGASYGNLGEYDKALDTMASICDDPQLARFPGQKFTYLMRLYQILWNKEEYKALWGAMEQAKKLFPDDPQPWAIQADIASKFNNIELARELAVHVLKRDYQPDAGLPIVKNVHEKMTEFLNKTQHLIYKEAI